MNNDINNELINRRTENHKPIETIAELMEIVKKYKELTSDKESRLYNYDEIETLRSRLGIGIKIENSKTLSTIFDYILLFLKSYGYETELFQKMFNNTSFCITDLKSAFNNQNGLAMSSGKKISYDYSIMTFDENGKFAHLNEKDAEFIIYVTIHELFHRISASRDDKKSIMVNDSALSEGFTDLFAEMVSGYNGERKSTKYKFSRDVCRLFAMINGMESTLSDYIDNIGVYPNLRGLFEKYDIDYKEFERLLDFALEKRYMNANEEEIIPIESRIIDILKNQLVLPFIKDHPEKEHDILTVFNMAFMNNDAILEESNKVKAL